MSSPGLERDERLAPTATDSTGDIESYRAMRSAALRQVRLIPLRSLTAGRADVIVAVIGGPVTPHPDLTASLRRMVDFSKAPLPMGTGTVRIRSA